MHIQTTAPDQERRQLARALVMEYGVTFPRVLGILNRVDWDEHVARQLLDAGLGPDDFDSVAHR